MINEPPSSRRDRAALLEQLPQRLQGYLDTLSSTAPLVERMAAQTCREVTPDFRTTLTSGVTVCKQMAAGLCLWAAMVRMEVYEGGHDWDDFEPPLEAEPLTECYQAIYRAAEHFDRSAKVLEASTEAVDRAQASLLWDCGTECDRMLAHLGSLRTGGLATGYARPRPERPVDVTIVHCHNHYDGATITFEAGSTQNGDVKK